MAYRWCPAGAKCSEVVGMSRQEQVQGLAARRNGQGWEIRVPAGEVLEVYDLRGVLVSATKVAGWVKLDALAKGVYLARVRGGMPSAAIRIAVP
jgi:hypothetical protein